MTDICGCPHDITETKRSQSRSDQPIKEAAAVKSLNDKMLDVTGQNWNETQTIQILVLSCAVLFFFFFNIFIGV